ncbi:M61 family peptidase [Algoriphagus sp. CAU 1675]|uniref:M61 family metallopeptidase n=1 Tax=Algoriphagus sp. CAU 1675 TaxID=3032597 RepID=UPI0023DB2FB5|nr:M61 family peptidase [Algoriphagus sp. CAU 1675]MDF2157002.1 M61 family peptidase [Algoriphagus sp. CAU 1675]
MINFTIECANPASQIIEIRVKIPVTFPSKIKMQLPAWRAGRYQLANFAQFIRNLTVLDQKGKEQAHRKISKDCWAFEAKTEGTYEVAYEFYAGKMDAGSSWVDEQQVYLNLVNCCLEISGTQPYSYGLNLSLRGYSDLVCTLPKTGKNNFEAKNFQELADSTVLAAKKLTHWKYKVGEIQFHCWIHGQITFDKNLFLERLKTVSEIQIRDFGEFPEKEYHFIFQLLPYPHYHGVEHKKGTVITFGPAESLKEEKQMAELMGVSSHELYHAWNVCRIRPKELLPYDFSRENYTESGWVLEGITTYMGDLYLLKSGFFDLKDYLKELEKTINKVSENFGWKNQSILDSSFDLWLDGYQVGIPDRKVNIYANGSLIALALDLLLLKNGSSLPEVMKMAWTRFGLPGKGYSNLSFWKLLRQKGDSEELDSFYTRFISGKENILEFLEEHLHLLGISLEKHPSNNPLIKEAGILVEKNKVRKIHPDSPAYSKVMVGDEIQSVTSNENVQLEIQRINGSQYSFSFPVQDSNYFPHFHLKTRKTTVQREKWMK